MEDKGLDKINEINKIVDGIKKNYSRLGIIITVTVAVVQIITALLLHYFLK